MSGTFPNANALWSYTLVETLRRKGLQQAVICPGSRSSPLAFGFAENDHIESISVLDERSAAYFALGLAKRSGVPTALVCTSGTAAANFFPAVIEASENGIPLLILTADRPPELRNCVAGQTIDQVKIYGLYPRESYELALPEITDSMLRYLRQTISEAYDRSLIPEPGPIHLNIPFRDPLPPVPQEGFETDLDKQAINRLLESVGKHPLQPLEANVNLIEFTQCEKGLVLVGPTSMTCSEDWISNVASLTNRLKWPILCDGLSPLRNYEDWFPNLISNYVAILRRRDIAEELAPERVIVLGELPVSKFLREWIERIEPETIVLSDRFRNADPSHSRTSHLYYNFNHGSPNCSTNAPNEYLNDWLEREQHACIQRDALMADCDQFFEGKVAWAISEAIPENAILFVSNSMPPRDLEFFWKTSDKRIQIYSSRGASGIDGILSTALGIAHGGESTVLLTGDLALLHDSNGGLLCSRIEGSLTIVLINNNGGGIFEMLPVSQFGDVFENYFATPQSIDFKQWSELYGISYQKIDSWDSFHSKMASLPKRGVRLLEIQTNRKADAATRKDWLRKIGGD